MAESSPASSESAPGSQAPQESATEQTPAKPRHRCFLCDRTYERHDHLNRHLKTQLDDNERAYRCPDCGKGFNRAYVTCIFLRYRSSTDIIDSDLLNRHRAAHAKVNQGEPMRKRIEKACEACIRAKTKCDDDRPCKRCKKRKVECIDTEERRPSEGMPMMPNVTSVVPPADSSSIRRESTGIVDAPHQIRPSQSLQQPAYAAPTPYNYQDVLMQPPMQQIPGTETMPGPLGPPTDMSSMIFDYGYPDFFEQIMMPGGPGMNDPALMPPDVMNFNADFDFGPADFDFSFLSDGLARTPAPPPVKALHASEMVQESVPTPGSEAGSRSEALDKSPWSWNHWIPPQGVHAFSEHYELDVQQDRVDAADQMTSPSARQYHHVSLDYEARDRMMRVVTQCTIHRLSVPSFPSLQLLEDLIDLALLQDSYQIDSIIHAPTFDPKRTRTESLLAMVAKGAGCVALPPIWKVGLILQEVVRFAVGEIFEKDNSTTREIQAVRASMLWIYIGVWSGFRRKTEIASAFLQPVATMMTWSNAFSRFRYAHVAPTLHDSDAVLEEKWREWVEQESWKRLCFHIFLHDSQVMLVQIRPALISSSQMLLPIPAARDLWHAPNAHAWRNAFLARQSLEAPPLPSLVDIVADPLLIGTTKLYADKPLCQLLVAHAIAHDVSEYRQQAQMMRHYPVRRQTERGPIHNMRLREIYESLSNFLTFSETDTGTPPELTFTLHFLMMTLHVSLGDIQLFSGRAGEDEARKIYPQIKAWTEESESRHAVWHAGQVFRSARTFEKTRLRDFYAVAVHHAALTLWVYGMVTSNASRNSGVHTPVGNRARHSQILPVATPTGFTRQKFCVDGPEDKHSKAFTQLGRGVPGLQSVPSTTKDVLPSREASTNVTGDFCALYNTKGVMLIAAAVLRGNFPQSKQGLPPLVDNLANLMDELGRLSD
ncbi:hypothetical protein LTR95_000738 [Oleoguttula sp. CCFEE 5521]